MRIFRLIVGVTLLVKHLDFYSLLKYREHPRNVMQGLLSINVTRGKYIRVELWRPDSTVIHKEWQ